MAESYPETHEGWRYYLTPVSEGAAGGFGDPLRMLLAASGVVLLIVCLNVAGLVVVRSLGRSAEIAVRSAIGAGRTRLIRQLVTENALLSIGGGVLGLVLAWLLVDYLRLWIPSTYWASHVLRVADIRIDPWVTAFSVSVALASGLLFGLIPAFRGTSMRLADWIKEGSSRGVGASRSQWSRHWLSVAQVSLAVVLTAGACLLIRSFAKLHGKGAGFQPENIVSLPIALDEGERKTEIERFQLYQSARLALAGIPGVEDVTVAGGNRLTGGQSTSSYRPQGRHGPSRVAITAFHASADPGHFRMMGIPLIKGREFDQSDRPDSAPVAIVNQEAARRFWPAEDPIRKKIFLVEDLSRNSRGSVEEPGMTVVGVVGDVREDGLFEVPHPVVYQPTSQTGGGGTFFLKTTRDPATLYREILATLRSVSANNAPFPAHYDRLDRLIRDSTWQLNYSMLLLTALAGLALLVSAVGVYGVLSYTVRQRTREIGLRMAVGAAPSEVTRMVLRRGFSIAATGVAIGIVVAMTVTRLLESLLYGVEPLDSITFALVTLVMMAAAFVASYVPARRATRVDPMAALRHE